MLATLATFLKQSVVLRGPGHNDCLDPSPFGHLDVSENAKLWPFNMDIYGSIWENHGWWLTSEFLWPTLFRQTYIFFAPRLLRLSRPHPRRQEALIHCDIFPSDFMSLVYWNISLVHLGETMDLMVWESEIRFEITTGKIPTRSVASSEQSLFPGVLPLRSDLERWSFNNTQDKSEFRVPSGYIINI